MTAPTQQLADMTTQIADRAGRKPALAKAQALRDMLRDGRLDEIPDVAKDDSLRHYVEQRVRSRRRSPSNCGPCCRSTRA